MLDWFEQHPDKLTRESLKTWAGSKSVVSSGGESVKKDFETSTSSVIEQQIQNLNQ